MSSNTRLFFARFQQFYDHFSNGERKIGNERQAWNITCHPLKYDLSFARKNIWETREKRQGEKFTPLFF